VQATRILSYSGDVIIIYYCVWTVDTRRRRRLQTEPAGVGPPRYDVHRYKMERDRVRETCLRRSPKNVLHSHTPSRHRHTADGSIL